MQRTAYLLQASVAVAWISAPLTARPAEPLRDPMRPPIPAAHGPAAARAVGPVLSAVMTHDGRRSAIFNGTLVHDGSVVGAYTIDAVLEDGVRYREAHTTHELHLSHLERPIKRPAVEPARLPSGESP